MDRMGLKLLAPDLAVWVLLSGQIIIINQPAAHKMFEHHESSHSLTESSPDPG